MARTTKKQSTASRGPAGIRELRVIRYSDVSDLDGLEQMAQRLWRIPTDCCPQEGIGELGSRPLLDPGCVERGTAKTIAGANTRYVLFDAGPGIKALYVLGSAASDNQVDGSNAFTTVISDAINELRPHRLVLPTLDRLVREPYHANLLWRAVSRHVAEVVTETMVLTLASADSEMRFQFEVLKSSLDRSSINNRMVTGRVTKYRNGECPISRTGIPFGYRKGPDKRVRVAVEDKQIIEAIVKGIAAGDRNADIVAAVAMLGGSTPALRQKHGDTATVADHINPGQLVSQWRRDLEIWDGGRFEWPFAFKLSARGTYSGLEVREMADGTHNLIFPLEWGVPEGGWVDPAVMAQARERAAKSQNRGGGTHRMRLPLTGFDSWADYGFEYRIFSNGNYELRRRQGASTGGWGRRPNLEGERLFFVSPDRLHESIVAGVLRALRNGVATERRDVLSMISFERLHVDTQAITLANRQRDLLSQVNNLKASIRSASSEQAAAFLSSDLDSLFADLSEVDAELRNLPEAPDDVEGDGLQIIRALALLSKPGARLERGVADDFRTVIQDLRLEPLQMGTARWSLSLLLPAAHGTFALGPITDELSCSPFPDRPYTIGLGRLAAPKDRAAALTARFMTGSETVNEIASADGMKGSVDYLNAVRGELQRLGLGARPAAALTRSGGPSAVRAVLWNELKGYDLPRGLDPAFVSHVVRAYRDTTPGPHWPSVRRGLGTKRAVAAALIAADNSLTVSQLHDSGVIDRSAMWVLLRADRALFDKGANRGDVRVRACPHCDGLASVVWLEPEVTEGALCPDCLRMPTNDSPMFPAEYGVLPRDATA